jgi:hypothetical protein
MRIIHIQARYTSEQSELLDASLRDASLAIESAVSVALLELCGEVQIDAVWLEDERTATLSQVHAESSSHQAY